MVGYTTQGASDSQWFPNEPTEAWAAVKAQLADKRARSCDDRSMRMEVNLGMTAFTGNVIATVGVQATPQGGAMVTFSGRMGAFSGQNIAGQRRIENERTSFLAGVAARLPEVSVATPASPPALSIADELLKLVQLRDAGVLTEAEFAVQKAAVLGR